jgi:hypothetical protein
MRRVLMIAIAITCFAFSVRAQQGPSYLSPEAGRGHAFPKHVSPTSTNPTNWVRQKHEYTDPNGPNSKRYYRFHHYHRHHHQRRPISSAQHPKSARAARSRWRARIPTAPPGASPSVLSISIQPLASSICRTLAAHDSERPDSSPSRASASLARLSQVSTISNRYFFAKPTALAAQLSASFRVSATFRYFIHF